MPHVTPTDMDKAVEIFEKIRDEWMKRPGVTAVDLGFKWSEGKMTDQLSIRVHVVRKKDKDELTDEELFPKEVNGIPVDIIEATYTPQALADSKPEAAASGRGIRHDVIPLGVSVGCRHSTAGTLGAKVFDRDNGEAMILSNWHVLAGRTDVEAGLPIWQPGWVDGGTRDENTIAQLTRWVLGPYDAAVATLTGQREVKTTTAEGRPIEDIGKPTLGMMVWKSGRTTGYTEGFVDGVKMRVALSYRQAGTHQLEEVFRIVPRPGAGDIEVSLGGDSGSVWVDEATGRAVGLHFAGEAGDSPEHALAHDINFIVDTLGVRFPAQAPPPDAGPGPGEEPVTTPPDDEPGPDQPSTDRPGPDRPTGGQSPSSIWSAIARLLRRLFG